jgi:hypothetical protein
MGLAGSAWQAPAVKVQKMIYGARVRVDSMAKWVVLRRVASACRMVAFEMLPHPYRSCACGLM